MFGFGSSSKPAAPEPTAPTREQRAKCWATRDEYFACLDRAGVVQPGDPKTAGELGDKESKCEAERATYEGNCGRSWIDYFNKRRVLEFRSAKTLEAAAAQHAEAAAKQRR